jgi:nucleoside 2-deoxyribosyltransferase
MMGAQKSQSGGLHCVRCDDCGTYRIHEIALSDLNSTRERFARQTLAALARYHAGQGQVLEIHGHDWQSLIDAAPTPQSLPDALEALLSYVGERQRHFSDFVPIVPSLFPITVARNSEDFRYVAELLQESGYAELHDDSPRYQFRLKTAGWTRLNELRATRSDSSRAFVAMWFADDLTPAWTEGIRPGLEDLGYTAVRLDAVEHNEKIDDRIIAEIRRSGLVVADMTGGRANVYFEAGFAMGLGIPIIWTCRKDDVDQLHFDTRQYNYIDWTTPAELRERLRLRIEATLPRKAEARR